MGTCFLNAWALERAHSSMVATYACVQPLLGEAPGVATLLAGVAIFVGIALVVLGGGRAAASRG